MVYSVTSYFHSKKEAEDFKDLTNLARGLNVRLSNEALNTFKAERSKPQELEEEDLEILESEE
jgi:hypothetical protein